VLVLGIGGGLVFLAWLALLTAISVLVPASDVPAIVMVLAFVSGLPFLVWLVVLFLLAALWYAGSPHDAP
jgi:hypothetical protein